MFRKVKNVITSGERFLITTHVDPDGDAIGSCFALYWALSALKKNCSVYMRDHIPYMYTFLPGPEKVFHREIPEGDFDAIFALDCGNLFRVGNGHEGLSEKGFLINVDHHATNEAFGTVNIIDQDSSSTAAILYKLFKSMKVSLTFNVAVNLYTAIFTDTGSFRYPNTNSQAFLICEEMTRYGVSPSHVAQMVHENHPKERFLLLGEVLATLETYDHDTVAMALVTQEMYSKTNTSKEYTEGFVEHIKEIRGIDVAILIREVTADQCKVSMRSKGHTDVASICNIFGGGGHRNAAGCNMEGTVFQARTRLKEALKIA